MASLDETISAFLDAMRSCGVNMDTASRSGQASHPIADGKLHRANALGKKSKNNQHVWYVLHTDEPASGAFGDVATGVHETWTSKKPGSMTPAEREALKKRMEDAQRQRAEDLARIQGEAQAAAGAIMAAATKARPDHAYLARKQLPVFPGLRQLTSDVKYTVDGEPKTARAGSLVVPIYRPDAACVSVQLIDDKGTKRFLKGTAKLGNYHSIGKPTDTLVVAEGYATGARVHQATGHCTFVAFDAGNLKPVAEAVRAKYPDAAIIIAADNDRFTKLPDGTRTNPGIEGAKAAAEAVRARVAVPLFDDEPEPEEGAPTPASDFDDVFRLEGLASIADAIESARSPEHVPAFPQREAVAMGDEPPPHMEMPDGPTGDPDMDARPMTWDEAGEAVAAREGEAKPHPLELFGAPHFRCLGIDGTTCYYQPATVSQVIALSASAHTKNNLLLLAPLEWWEMEFPAKGGMALDAAVNACIRASKHKRKFVSHNRIRGRGAWFEGEDAVFHAGDRLYVNAAEVGIAEHESRHVYDEGDAIPVAIDKAASTEEARKFLTICKSLRWASPLSAYMLAGFCVVAPVCGFLKWRPHVWINGPAGSGKSTVLDKIVNVAIKEVAHSVVGNTTEAGLRSALGMDAVPVIFDEVEPKDKQAQERIRGIMDLARVASSESDGLILKGTSGGQGTKGYRVRTMFVFASINTQIEGYADETRFTQLTLVKPDADNEEEEARNKAQYEQLVSEIADLLTPSFARRLLARTITLLPRLREYVDIFTTAAALHLGTQRLGDQVGPLLAGAYLLNGTGKLTVEKALAWIRANDWTDHSAKSAARDTDRFLQLLANTMVKNNTPEGGNWERTIGELVELAQGPEQIAEEKAGWTEWVPNRHRVAAAQALARCGMKVVRSSDGVPMVEVGTTCEHMKRVVRSTEWAGTKISTLLKQVDGAAPGKGNRYFHSGVNCPFVTMPAAALMGTIAQPEDLSA